MRIKKLGLFIFGLVSLGLINFSNATNYTCSDSFTITEDSYFIINYEIGRLGSIEIINSSTNDLYSYTNSNGFSIDNSGTPISSFPLVLTSGTWEINCSNITNSSFSVVPAITSCPTCPTCPGINGQCSVSDKVSENIIFRGSKNFSTSYSNMFNYGDYGAGTYCLKFTSSNPQTLTMGFANGPTTAPTNLYSLYNDQYGNTICLYGNKPYLNVKLNSSSNTINYEVYKLTDLLSEDIPCSTPSSMDLFFYDPDNLNSYNGNRYSLPFYDNYLFTFGNGMSSGNGRLLNFNFNSFDFSTRTVNGSTYGVLDFGFNDNLFSFGCDYSEYESQIESLSGSLALCQSENSTLSGNLTTCEGELNSCMSGVGSGDLQRSALYINNIQHLGASVINIDIPEEISWSYTNDNDEFDLDVEGYNVDTEYISGIIDTQSTLPNQVDLNNLVKVILPLFVPGLVIILFIYFIFRFIKKVF